LNRFVGDTHAIGRFLTDDPKLSPRAKGAFEEASRGTGQILVPGIVLAEMVYLVERLKITEALLERLLDLVAVGRAYAMPPLNKETIEALRRVPRSAVPDMPNRIIAATALQLGLPLITRDEAIRRSGVVPVVW
jgi:predicted nucleic acid-binding protein